MELEASLGLLKSTLNKTGVMTVYAFITFADGDSIMTIAIENRSN